MSYRTYRSSLYKSPNWGYIYQVKYPKKNKHKKIILIPKLYFQECPAAIKCLCLGCSWYYFWDRKLCVNFLRHM